MSNTGILLQETCIALNEHHHHHYHHHNHQHHSTIHTNNEADENEDKEEDEEDKEEEEEEKDEEYMLSFIQNQPISIYITFILLMAMCGYLSTAYVSVCLSVSP